MDSLNKTQLVQTFLPYTNAKCEWIPSPALSIEPLWQGGQEWKLTQDVL